jgi:hypothetical protein
MVLCAEPEDFPIPEQTARWFRQHGGTQTVVRALRQYMRAHAGTRTVVRARRTVQTRNRR